MKKDEHLQDENAKIIEGLKLVRERLIAFKRYKNSPIVISRNGQIVELDPFEVLLENEKNKTN